jgi:hypothetical protein
MRATHWDQRTATGKMKERKKTSITMTIIEVFFLFGTL